VTSALEPLSGQAFRVEVVMGMPIGIDLRDPAARRDPQATEALLDRCYAALRAADDWFSLWRPDTAMARLATGQATLAEMPVEVVEVLRLCVLATRATDGRFLARDLSGRVDPTGLVKGWAVARVGRLLLAAGRRDWCITAAGDVLVHGEPRPAEPWVIGIADPDRPRELLDAVRLSAGAVATSGPAERGSHIWDPLRGNAARGVRSVSVVCTDILRADVLATAAVARGAAAAAWLERLPGVEALVVHESDRLELTSGWARLAV
jgi:thiamine biosynthesis lipoprotein